MKIETYKQATEFLFTQIPVFQNQGASAYKPGLERVMTLDNAFGNAHRRFATVHIAGTNGKGSVSSTLAAILQSAGYRTGLFTSPHLRDFRERIRVDGKPIPEEEVIAFMNRWFALSPDCEPSFFELTTVMAFDWFARSGVEVAVIETGLGGRLDSTNIITPLLSVITNISLDHTGLLGSTPEAIAREKAGIIKPGVPAVVGEAEGSVREVFADRAAECGSPLTFADRSGEILSWALQSDGNSYVTEHFGDFTGQLSGECQARNMATILCAVDGLRRAGLHIPDSAVTVGAANVVRLTGLMGRWTRIAENPTVVIDTGHNPGGWVYTAERLKSIAGPKRLVIGFVGDKDVATILDMVAASVPDAEFFFTQPGVERRLDSAVLRQMAAERGLRGRAYATVAEAFRAASTDAASATIFVGGSNFVVAELLDHLDIAF